MRKRAKKSDEAKRLMIIPGIGPICAMAVQAFAPPMESFRRGRDSPPGSALSPASARREGSRGSAGSRRWGSATAVIRWASRRGTDDPWLAALPDRKPPMLAAAVLANRMARIVRAVSTKREPAGLPLSPGRRAAVETAGTDEEMKKKGGGPEFGFRLRTQGGRRRRRGKNRGQCRGERSSRRNRENHRAFKALPSTQKRFGPGPRISMQASGRHQRAAPTGRTHESA